LILKSKDKERRGKKSKQPRKERELISKEEKRRREEREDVP
jgi:hypothetical protein